MEKVIIIKYGELSTKSDNINFFLKTLKDNIDKKLSNINHEIKYDYGRMIIYTEDIDNSITKLKEVFGIHEIAIGYLLENRELSNIKDNVLSLIKDKTFNTFRVTVKRSDKRYPGNST